MGLLYPVIQLRLMFSPFSFLVKRPKYDTYKMDRPSLRSFFEGKIFGVDRAISRVLAVSLADK